MEIGKTVGKAALDLAQNEAVLNKTSNLMGMLFPYAGLRKKALEMYISDVEKSDMSSESKLIAVLNAKDTIKKLKNQKKIAEIAMDNAKEGTDFTAQSGVNEEWLNRFMESAGFVSSDDIQDIWGKLLSKEFESPGSTPMNMVRILSEMTPFYAQAFRKICSMQGVIVGLNSNGKIVSARQDVIVPFNGNEERFAEMGLTFNVFSELETLGLLKFESVGGFLWKGITAETILFYVDDTTEVITKHRNDEIPSGNIMLTAAGKCLKAITPLEEIEDYEYMVKQLMLKEGIQFMEEPDFQIQKAGSELEVMKKVQV